MKEMVVKFHQPDITNDEEAKKRINEAFDVLFAEVRKSLVEVRVKSQLMPQAVQANICGI